MSANGDYLYKFKSNYPRTQSFWLGSLRHGRVEAGTIAQVDAGGNIVPDPFGQYVGLGSLLYNESLTTQVARLPVVPHCFDTARPLLFGLEAGGIVSLSRNSLVKITNVPLPPPVVPPDQPELVDPMLPEPARAVCVRRARILLDAPHSRALTLYRRHAAATPLEALDPAREPMLVVRAAIPAHNYVNEQIEVPLEAPDSRVTVALAEAPPGMTLSSNVLRWRTPDEAVGLARVKLSVAANGAVKTQELKIAVERPHVRLPFNPSDFAVSADGRRAFAWYRDEERGGLTAEPPASRVALVDLDRSALLVEKTLPYVVAMAAVGFDAVYVSSANAPVIKRLSLQDLSETRQVFMMSRATQLDLVDGDLLFAGNLHTFSHDNPFPRGADSQVFKASDLSLVSRERPNGSRWMPPPVAESILVRVTNGWSWNGVVFDEQLKEPRLIWRPHWESHWLMSLPRWYGGPTEPIPWNRAADSNSIFAPAGRHVANFQSQDTVLLADDPVVISLNVQQPAGQPSGGPARIVDVMYRDLLTGLPQHRVTLLNEPAFTVHGRRQPQRHKLRSTHDAVIVLAGDRIIRHPLNQRVLATIDGPPAFELRQQRLTIDLSSKTTLAHHVRGGKPPYTFALFKEEQCLAVDAVTGQVSIDGPVALKRCVSAIFEHNDDVLAQYRGPQQGFDHTEDRIQRYTRRLHDLLAPVLPEPLKGVPVGIPIDIAVRDDRNDAAALHYYVIADVPSEAVTAALKKRGLARPRL